MISLNLIPMQIRSQRKMASRKGRWCAVVVGFGMALVIAGAVWRMAIGTPPDLAARLHMVHGEIDSKSAELNKLTSELAENRTALQLSRAMNGQPDWGFLLALLVKVRGDDVVLSQCEISAPGEVLNAGKTADEGRPVLKLQGLARTQAAVSSFTLKLEQTGLFESIERVSNRQSQAGLDAVGFNLECQLKTSIATTKPSHRPSQASATTGGGDE
jgi:hypothetical protein